MPVALDAAVLDAMHFQMSPPAIVRPAIDFGNDAVAMRRQLASRRRVAEEQVQKWIESTIAQFHELEALFAALPKVTEEQLNQLLYSAQEIERDAAEQVALYRRGAKKFGRLVKQAKAMSSLVGDVVAEADRDMKALFDRELEARLEGALRFRALRSTYIPDNDTGMKASSPADVDRLFAEMMAS